MKKVLALLIICLSCTMMFAQKANPDSHYSVVSDENNMSWYTVLVIDGEEQFENTAERYEVGVIDQNGDCRCAKFSKRKKIDGVYHYEYILTIQGHAGLVFTFEVWDHQENCALDVTYAGEPLEFEVNGIMGSPNNPSPTLNFTSNGAASGITKDIIGYDTEAGDHWYLISSPVGAIDDATAVENLINGEYDFYSFDQTGGGDGLEWKNYEAGEFAGFEVGKGYLYANAADVTLTFNGTAYTEGGAFDLEYAEEVQDPNMKGWNLMGNPYNANAEVDHDVFLVMDGAVLVPNTSNIVEPMQGILIKAQGTGEQVVFTPQETGDKKPMFALNLTKGRKLVDRAVVRFSEGRQLPKIQIFKDTKLYFPMDGEEYAVVRSEGIGEIPVSFKAETNGSYTLSINSEDVSFGYLHLIDNLTGADVDLLANPIYNFEAKTTDYTSRFKLVFATANEGDNFAFFSNGNLVISNEGNATLQVVDVTGRIIKCETINGCASVNIDAASGVYMIRLINGDNVKVQKVVK